MVTSEQTDKADKMGQVWGYVYSNLMEQICVHTLSNDMFMIFMVQSTNISILWTNDIYMIFMEQIFPWNNDMYMVFMEQICSYLEQLYGFVFTKSQCKGTSLLLKKQNKSCLYTEWYWQDKSASVSTHNVTSALNQIATHYIGDYIFMKVIFFSITVSDKLTITKVTITEVTSLWARLYIMI